MLEPLEVDGVDEPLTFGEVGLDDVGRVELVEVLGRALELLGLPEVDELLIIAEFELDEEETIGVVVEVPELAAEEETTLRLEGLLIVLEAVITDDEPVTSPGHVDTLCG